jgi:intein/homing endonuclease
MEKKDVLGNPFKTNFQEFIYTRTYSRWLESEKRRETWFETVSRVINFFREELGKKTTEKELELVFNAIYDLEVMPSMRLMWSAGEAMKQDHFAGYNCSFSTIESIKDFASLLYILMHGCFEKGTLIKTKNGDKKLSDITLDDEIMSYDIKNDSFEFIKPNFVGPTLHSKEKEKMELEFEDGLKIKCTSDHEFFTENRGWVKAKDLDESDEIRNFHEVKKTPSLANTTQKKQYKK